MLLMWLNIMLLILGTALDLAPLLLICTPILLPVVKSFGIDPVHFGIVMLLNLGIGLLTPPVGTTLFVGCAIGKVSVDEVMRGIWPFYYVLFTVLMIVTYVPGYPGFARMLGFWRRHCASRPPRLNQFSGPTAIFASRLLQSSRPRRSAIWRRKLLPAKSCWAAPGKSCSISRKIRAFRWDGIL
jgi:Na+/H+ antiporter NhaD/arsenite permease-like protein